MNARGGGERLAVATIKALASMGIDVELETFERPDFQLIHKAYGESIENDIKKIRTLKMLQVRPANHNWHIIVNTHGDMLPFFQPCFSKSNAITYCHFPIAKYLIDCNDQDYTNLLQNLSLSCIEHSFNKDYFQAAKNAYNKMILNSTVLTNSEFSHQAIFKVFGIDSTILHPPVDVDSFRRAVLSSSIRDDLILVVSRFHPSKKIENAIRLASILKRNGIGKYILVVGNISPGGMGYYNNLVQLVKNNGLQDFVRFKINVTFEKLLNIMRKAKVYFHTLPGEPFGISTVEAMSAGIIPVVPDIGGHTEFVPQKYQFHTFGEGVEAIAAALNAPMSERIKISDSTRKYSMANYIKRFQQIVSQILDNNGPIQQAPQPLVSTYFKRHSDSMVAA